MDWQDEEFETFLRQFRPSKPKALPTHRPRIVALGTAAVIVVAVIITARYGSKGPEPNDSTQTPASTPSGSASLPGGMNQRGGGDVRPNAVPDHFPSAEETSAGAAKGTAIVSDLPTLSPLRGARQRSSPPSNGTVSSIMGAANRRLRVGGNVEAPRKLVDVAPIYPDDAQTAGIEGIVILEIVIGEDGLVIETSVLRSIPELDQAAIDAVSQWQYETTLLNGDPVEIEMIVTINFTLAH
jgi:TonB family protein